MIWKCKSCGESHEDQFDSCWKCGSERIGSVPADLQAQDEPPVTSTMTGMDIPCSTTPSIPGREIVSIKGIVCGDAIMGANILRDFVAGITDIVGGRSGVYEAKLREGRLIALNEMKQEARDLGADAIIGVDIDYETVGDTMMMISATGTAVLLKKPEVEQAGA